MDGGYIVHRPGLQGWAAPTPSVDSSHDVLTLSCTEQGQLTGPQMPAGYKKQSLHHQSAPAGLSLPMLPNIWGHRLRGGGTQSGHTQTS